MARTPRFSVRYHNVWGSPRFVVRFEEGENKPFLFEICQGGIRNFCPLTRHRAEQIRDWLDDILRKGNENG